MRKLIAFTGAKKSGKTSSANHLIENYGYIKHYFAKPLKDMLKCLGLNEEQVNGTLKEIPCEELCGMTPRKALQLLGTEYGRNLIHNNIWVQAWKNTMPNGDIVCDDLRFPNEHKMIKLMDGIIIDISRPGFERTNEHESEAHVLPYDYQINNNGTLEDLNHKIDELYQNLIF